MDRAPIPLVVLGGSDRRPATLPPSGGGLRPLVGYKGVAVKIGGRCLVSVLIERFRRSGAFSPIRIAGPERVYREAGIDTPVIDTDGGFGDNIRAAVEATRREHPGRPVAVTTCDILPDDAQLSALVEAYRRDAPCDFWFSMILVPEDTSRLGEFGWKPKYRIVPEPGAPPASVLPGHVAILDPEALRLDFLYRLMQVGYATRNRPIATRRGTMVRKMLGWLLRRDLAQMGAFRAPTLTWTVIGTGIRAARGLRSGTMTRAELEECVRRIFVRRRHRRRHPERKVCLPLLEGLSLAEDIDTVEEADALREGERP